MPQNIKKAVWIIAILLCVLPTFAQKSQKRVALVIGNSDYGRYNLLRNPANDAEDLADALDELGFDVVYGVNQNKQQLENLIAAFERRIAGGSGAALIYYSGIGIQANGENFMVPVDASFASDDETVKTSVSLDTVLAKIKASKNSLNLILLDPVQSIYISNFWGKKGTKVSRVGFTKFALPANTLVFYSAQIELVARDKCGRNGYFAGAFIKQLAMPNLEFRKLAKNVSDDVSRKTSSSQKPILEGNSKKKFHLVDKRRRVIQKGSNSLEALFETFKAEGKCECGNRKEAVLVGKELIQKYGSDRLNHEVVEFVKTRVQKIEKEDPTCNRYNRYNSSVRAKNWAEFFAASKDLLAVEGDTPLALDVLLDMVSVGFDRAAVDKINTYDKDTISNAKTALERIDSGKTSFNQKWGVFFPFQTKADAQSWLNFIIGWEMYNKTNQKREALSYFYKVTQIAGAKKNDFIIYTYIGQYYFDQYERLYKEYKEKLNLNKNKENDETRMLLGLARGNAERAMDAFQRAYKLATNRERDKIKEPTKKTLEELYRFRFDIPPDGDILGADAYFDQLISRPLPDPSAAIGPILR